MRDLRCHYINQVVSFCSSKPSNGSLGPDSEQDPKPFQGVRRPYTTWSPEFSAPATAALPTSLRCHPRQRVHSHPQGLGPAAPSASDSRSGALCTACSRHSGPCSHSTTSKKLFLPKRASASPSPLNSRIPGASPSGLQAPSTGERVRVCCRPLAPGCISARTRPCRCCWALEAGVPVTQRAGAQQGP